jgi:hypothetical protein
MSENKALSRGVVLSWMILKVCVPAAEDIATDCLNQNYKPGQSASEYQAAAHNAFRDLTLCSVAEGLATNLHGLTTLYNQLNQELCKVMEAVISTVTMSQPSGQNIDAYFHTILGMQSDEPLTEKEKQTLIDTFNKQCAQMCKRALELAYLRQTFPVPPRHLIPSYGATFDARQMLSRDYDNDEERKDIMVVCPEGPGFILDGTTLHVPVCALSKKICETLGLPIPHTPSDDPTGGS